MDDIKRVRHPHAVRMEDRKKAQFTGITDVVSFEPSKVILESDYGVIVIKGESLHVNKLSVEKGELDVDGRVDSLGVFTEQHKYEKRRFISEQVI